MPARSAFNAPEVRFLQTQRVAHLATASASGQPHNVPVCYATDGAHVYIALDDKPKRVGATELRRVRNIQERPEVSLVVDQYDDDWSRLGYVLIHAHAALLAPGHPDHASAVSLLRARYPQYHAMPIETRPIIGLTPDAVTSWGSIAALPDNDTLGSPSGRGVDFLPLARGRRSVRQYRDRPVPRALIEDVLEAARWAPSPHGRQPWRFVVLTRAEPRLRLADAMGAEWRRNLEMDQQPPEVVAIRLEKSRQRILRAPAIIIPCLYLADLDAYPDRARQDAETIMAIQSLGAAIQNMLLAAYSLGLDGGWMCAPLFCPEVVCAALDLDPALVPHALITLGYAARDPVRRPHRPVSDLLVRFD